MSKPLSIDSGVLRRLRSLPKNERVECLLALCELSEVFGQPHMHSGLSIRKLGERLFECRGNLALRFIFQNRPTDLFVSFLGNHDEIKALLRSGKYRYRLDAHLLLCSCDPITLDQNTPISTLPRSNKDVDQYND